MAQQGRKITFTLEEVLEAIRGSNGIMSVVARRLKVSRFTAKKWVDKWEATKEAYYNEEETVLDAAEAVIVERIQQKDLRVAQWLLLHKGGRRGYGQTAKREDDDQGEEHIDVQEVYRLGDGTIITFPSE